MASRRILISGVTGSGKSTLAKAVSNSTGLPLIDVDEIAWLPGWAEPPVAEQEARIDQLTSQPGWVIDSDYRRFRNIIDPRTDLIVCLDYPRWLSLGRLLVRCIKRSTLGKTCCNGNKESMRRLLTSESIILWHFKSFNSKRRRMQEWQSSPNHEVLVFQWPKQAERWLSTLTPAGAPPSSDS